jgi:hypothetical protein
LDYSDSAVAVFGATAAGLAFLAKQMPGPATQVNFKSMKQKKYYDPLHRANN